MKKQNLAALCLTLLLLFTSGISAIASEATADTDYSDTIDNSILQQDNPMPTQDTNIALSDFYIQIVSNENGESLFGTVAVLSNDTVQVQPLYSLDGEDYEPITTGNGSGNYNWDLTFLGTENPDELISLQTQLCADAAAEPFKSYLDGTINRFWVQLGITTESGETFLTKPSMISNSESSPLPIEPPKLSVQVAQTPAGYGLMGTFSDFTPDIIQIRPLYSLDGETFQPIRMPDGEIDNDWDLSRLQDWYASGDEKILQRLQTQRCSYAHQEPFNSYLNGTLESFYVRLEITKENGQKYDTQAALLSREEEQLPHADSRVTVSFPPNFRAKDGRFSPYYGLCQLTVQEGTTTEDLLSLLPKTLPITVHFEKQTPDKIWEEYSSGIVPYEVEWQLPDNLSIVADNEPIIIENVAKPINIPIGTKVSTYSGSYILTEIPQFDTQYYTGEIRIKLNVISADKDAEVGLAIVKPSQGGKPQPLSIAFNQKPTGANNIRLSYYTEGDSGWTRKGDLLDLLDIHSLPNNSMYGYITIFTSEESPFKEYLAGEIDGFLVGVEITGGIFDGESHIMNWPTEYQTPPYVPNITIGGGNEGNTGSGGDNSNEGGQRPNLPVEKPELPKPVTPSKPNHSIKPDPPSALAPLKKPETAPKPEPVEIPAPTPEIIKVFQPLPIENTILAPDTLPVFEISSESEPDTASDSIPAFESKNISELAPTISLTVEPAESVMPKEPQASNSDFQARSQTTPIIASKSLNTIEIESNIPNNAVPPAEAQPDVFINKQSDKPSSLPMAATATTVVICGTVSAVVAFTGSGTSVFSKLFSTIKHFLRK